MIFTYSAPYDHEITPMHTACAKSIDDQYSKLILEQLKQKFGMRTFEYCDNCKEVKEFLDQEGVLLCSECGEQLTEGGEKQ